ncbi:MAG: histidine ammonia-lyase [Bacteroidetes bacterium]|nr:MAG: histidine ammonia-lyase [Bacteroidota bacterium]
MKVEKFMLDSEWWTLEDLFNRLDNFLTDEYKWGMDDVVLSRVEKCHAYLANRIVSKDEVIYGVNTGFGALANTRIDGDKLSELQCKILISHACGVGEEVPEIIVSTMLLLKAKALGQGYSAVNPATIQRLLDMLNKGVMPIVPSQGSLGASGDLAPLSHLAIPMIGEGEVSIDGDEPVHASVALKQFGWSPLELGPKEGLALINGTQMMLGYGVVSMLRIEQLMEWADAIGAWSLESWSGLESPFDHDIHRIRNQQGAMDVAASVRSWVKGSEKMRSPRNHVQDPYSFRCMPQVHGATRDIVIDARELFENEINAVTDNPLVFPDEDKILSGGNFHGQPLALALDRLTLAVHELASISERRIFKLMSGTRNLPAFLAKDPGLNSGYMIAQYTAASLVSLNKQLTTPSSADNADSSNGQEDHVSMGANAALKLWMVIDNAEQVLAIEALCAAQASDLGAQAGLGAMSPRLEALQKSLRKSIPFLEEDAFMSPLLEDALDWISLNNPNTISPCL